MNETAKPKRHAPKGRIKAPADPLQPVDPLQGRCTATARNRHTGRCKQSAIPGGTVCRFHGGSAPQVKEKAEERLLALRHPAITRLGQLVDQKEYPSVAIAAVKDVLDRTMGKAIEAVTVEHSGGLTIRHELPE